MKDKVGEMHTTERKTKNKMVKQTPGKLKELETNILK